MGKGSNGRLLALGMEIAYKINHLGLVFEVCYIGHVLKY